MKHRFLSSPAHSCTPTMPKIKKTKKHSASTLPSIGSVSKSSVTRIRIPANTHIRKKKNCWQPDSTDLQRCAVTGSVGRTGEISLCVVHKSGAVQLIGRQIIRVQTLIIGLCSTLLKCAVQHPPPYASRHGFFKHSLQVYENAA